MRSRRRKKELARVTEERDIQKSHRVFRQEYRMRYALCALVFRVEPDIDAEALERCTE
jgi:hypothetical protein